MIDKLRDDLKRDEGVSLKPYKDSVGVLTIGVGRNIEDVGISHEEAGILLDNDIERSLGDLDRELPWWRLLPDDVQRGLANMSFNLGITRLLKFKRMIAALKARDWNDAAKEALDSKWAEQVGPRAHRIAKLFRDTPSSDP